MNPNEQFVKTKKKKKKQKINIGNEKLKMIWIGKNWPDDKAMENKCFNGTKIA